MASNKEERKKNTGFKVAFFVLILIVIGTITGCLFAPIFNITIVRAENGINISSGEILDLANIQLGVNIFRINDSKIEDRIETLSYVRRAKVERIFPNTIFLDVEERSQYAIVKYLESYVITDKFGYILEIKKENDLKHLPIIYGIDSGDFVIGEKLDGISITKFENCVYLLEVANNTEFKYNFTEINYDDPTNVKLYIEERDIDIVYGTVEIEGIEEKLRHLSSILEKLDGKKGKIDMSSKDYLAKTVFTEKK